MDAAIDGLHNIDLKHYARRVAEIKEAGHLTNRQLSPIEGMLSEGLRTVYRAVAFDIDGTVTQPPSVAIDSDLVGVLRGLLQRGVPVIFITGRGRSARSVAQSLRIEGLSRTYLRRLYCIIHNGGVLLETADEPDAEPLGLESSLAGRIDDVALIGEVASIVTPRLDVVDSSIRLSYAQSTIRDTEFQALVDKSDALGKIAGRELHFARGTYGVEFTIDISGTTKQAALEEFCRRKGISAESVLRIGDQGTEGGNDFELLDCPQGFSVGEVSKKLGHCHPVLASSTFAHLSGVAATRRLLEMVILQPRLRLEPDTDAVLEALPALRQVERVARQKAQPTVDALALEIGERFVALLGPLGGLATAKPVPIGDLFDPLSGAVRFRDWELDELGLPDDHPASLLFQLTEIQTLTATGKVPEGQYAMYSDTGLLLRGAAYYFGMTTSTEDQRVQLFLDEASDFVHRSTEACRALMEDSPSLVRFKLTLGIADNIRNIILQLGFLAFLVEQEKGDGYPFTQRFVEEWMVGHAKIHVKLLARDRTAWAEAHREYSDVLGRLDHYFADWRSEDSIFAGAEEPDGKSVFRIRECDSFVENLAAVRLGLQGHARQQRLSRDEQIVAVGLPYGGIELPVLAAVIAPDLELRVIPAFVRVSMYNDAQAGEELRAPAPGYVARLVDPSAVCVAGDPSCITRDLVFVMDDNCTTAKTVETARDVLVSMGADVAGAVLVRYPSTNRRAQMEMEGHGVPDPEVMLSFIRGLVAPSPYTRLISGGPADDPGRYKDIHGVFDKSKTRIERLLAANGTPRV